MPLTVRSSFILILLVAVGTTCIVLLADYLHPLEHWKKLICTERTLAGSSKSNTVREWDDDNKGTGGMNTDLVVFVYHEALHARRNLRFFLDHGIHAKIDLVLVINGNSSILDGKFIPSLPNIKVVNRNNTCFDLGTDKELLTSSADFLKRYHRFILLNASMRGPFLPFWTPDKWTDLFFRKLSEKVKMVGATFNCVPVRHVQSTVLAMDRIGLELVLPVLSCYSSKQDAINNGELKLTKAILEGGYRVDVMMTSFRSSENYLHNCTHDDTNVGGNYFGLAGPQLYETIFIKAHYNGQQSVMDQYTVWHDQIRQRSL